MRRFEVVTERGPQPIVADRAESTGGELILWPETGSQPIAVFAPGHWSSFMMIEDHEGTPARKAA